MRIGMILDKTFPPDPRVENEAHSLIVAGHEVLLFCLSYGNETQEENYNGIQVKRYLSNKLEYKLSALSYDFPFYRYFMKKKIKDFLQKNEIDALHVHDITVAKAVVEVNEKFKIPLVLDLHDNIPENMIYYPHLQKFPGKYIISPKRWKKEEEKLIHKSDYVITVSPEFVDEIVDRTNISKDKIVMVPNSVRREFYSNYEIKNDIIQRYKDHYVLLYVGDTNLRRGLLTVIKAVPELIENIPNLKFVIVGKNTTDSVLKEEAKKLQVEKYIDFEGWQDMSLFPSYIQASNVCLSPLHRSPQHDVAYANKIFQYMSLGKPILVSDAIAQKRIVERAESGLVHEERNPKDFAKKVFTLYSDTDLAENAGKCGKEFIENEFSWEITSKSLVRLYERI